MGDRFKFRFWDKYWDDDAQKYSFCMVYTDKLDDEQLCGNYLFNTDKDDIIMQSTGLRDKNGTLIYEGDCLGSMHNVVEYIDGEYVVAHDRLLSSINKYNKVIGNIYENKKLFDND